MEQYFNPYAKYDEENIKKKDVEEKNNNRIIDIELEKLIPSKNQPFRDYSKNEMDELKKSIMRVGLQYPIIVRKIDNERYEILSGHNRVQAYKELGYKTIPSKVVNVDDDTAQMILIDTNIVQRESLSVMERARAYKIKDEIKRRKKYNVDQVSENLTEEEKEELDKIEARQTFYRYLSLNNLIPEYQEQCENGMLSVTSGEHISKLNEKQQKQLLETLGNVTIAEPKANEIKKLFQNNSNCSSEDIKNLYVSKKKESKSTIRFNKKEAEELFEHFNTNEEIKTYIIALIKADLKLKNK